MNSNFALTWGTKLVSVTLGFIAVWVCIKISILFIKKLEGKYSWLSQHSPLVKNIIRIAIVIIGFLIILDSLGISITPMIASLGLGGFAVGLALQDTLSNYLSGLYLMADKPIRIGDFVRLDSGEEGHVSEIGWRSTKIRMLANKTVIIPNKLISSSRVTNYDFPSADVAVLVEVGVHYNSDLNNVESVTIEVARHVQRSVPDAVKSFEPFIRYHTFGESSINFTVILRAGQFVGSYLIKHEFIKQLHERYNKEGITIPFPIRNVYVMQNEKTGGNL